MMLESQMSFPRHEKRRGTSQSFEMGSAQEGDFLFWRIMLPCFFITFAPFPNGERSLTGEAIGQREHSQTIFAALSSVLRVSAIGSCNFALRFPKVVTSVRVKSPAFEGESSFWTSRSGFLLFRSQLA
jgi:hypothetical protein